MFQFNIVFGILIAFVSNALLAGTGANAWRWMLGRGRVSVVALTPRSASAFPKVRAGCSAERATARLASKCLQRIEPEASTAELTAEADAIIAASTEKASSGHFWTMRLRKPILLAILIAFFNQMSGINAILYFAPRIFELTGLAAKTALLQSIGIGLTNLVLLLSASG